ncbi:hypothetical protein C9E82_23685 [Paracoccus siganidrum]|uniref:DUF3800 domain-containing protein n=2 Tax=Paracoccus siganidrum TaxID=1276757 RepID=A0A418ZR49_9RHOB|nr:hypothetical protein D3P05_23915 [Paracoccus siganidrum]RMC23996.1 hypothetical protein C9E82_23685 [Paracoccus siganidrum]
MTCFRIDESGYTGFDLLNADQRFQGASAIAIDDDEAARLIKEHFPRIQATELKYRALSRRTSNHSRLLGLMRDLMSDFDCVTYVADKRFMLTLMFVDYSVEPYYYVRGIDFYENGQNYAMASMLHIAGPTLLGIEEFAALMDTFQRAMKEKSPQSLQKLVEAARATNWSELPEVLGPLAQYADIDCLSAIATPGVSTDIAIVILISLITRMEVMADGAYQVEHDQSKNLSTYHDLLQRYIDHDEEVEFRATEITSLRFPLKLTEVTQVDSKSSPAVQLADIMIGAAIEAANNLTGLRPGGLDPEYLMPLYREDQFIHMIPSIDFEEQRRFRSGSQNGEAIEYLASNLFGKKR